MPSASRTNSRNRNRPRPGVSARPLRIAATPAPLPVTPRPGLVLKLLVALPAFLFIVGIALAIAVNAGLVALSLVGAVLAFANLRLGSPRRLLAELGGRVLTSEEEPRLFNVLEGLCIENGITLPEVRILEDGASNALVQPSGHGRAVLFCTRGLLDNLDRIALQGAIADELASWKQGDLELAAAIGFALGAMAALSARAAALAWRFTDPTRQFRADRAACRMTRYPPGLLGALATLDSGPTSPAALSTQVQRLTGPFWLVPLAVGKPVKPRPGELDLELRISALAEL
jgi:Zn-dependent protease with chaperone function